MIVIQKTEFSEKKIQEMMEFINLENIEVVSITFVPRWTEVSANPNENVVQGVYQVFYKDKNQ